MKSLRETDGDLVNHWYIACLESEISEKPLGRTVYELPIVLFRDASGGVKAFEDRCSHRGSALSGGRVENGCLRCPYHGWLFDREGCVVEVPSDGPQQKVRSARPSLKAIPTVVQDGCVWVWVGGGSPRTEKPVWRFPFRDHEGWQHYFMITDFQNDVTHLLQNFMDVPHTVFVHDKWFRKRRLMKVPITVDVIEGRVKVTYHQKGDSIGVWSRILNHHGAEMVHTDEFIFPNLTRVDYVFGKNHFVINSQCTPINRYESRVYTWIAFRLGALTLPLKPLLRFYTRQVIEQDVDIMRNQGTNLKRFEQLGVEPAFTARNGYQSTQADELHLALDRLRELGKKDAASVYEVSFSREREFWI